MVADKTGSLVLLLALVTGNCAEPLRTGKRPLFSRDGRIVPSSSSPREGRFISTHLDLLSSYSSLFPSFLPANPESLDDSTSEKQVAEERSDMDQEEMEAQGFGEKLSAQSRVEVEEAEEAISALVDSMKAHGGDPPKVLEDVFKPEVKTYQEDAPVRRPYGGYRRRPAGTPEPFVFICKDPNNCPPPYAPSPYAPRPSYGSGISICRDPNNCPVPYGAPKPRPFRIRPRPQKDDGDVPRYTPDTTTRRPVKKYGYHPVKSNPTIYRQEVSSMKGKAPEDVEEVDIENMSMDELREFIAAAEAEKESEAEPTTFEKLTTLPAISPEEEMEKVERVLSNMNVQELVDFVKASTVLEAGVPVLDESEVEKMTMTELKKVVEEAGELPKVMKQVDAVEISQMTKATLKEVVEDILEDHEEDLKEMTKTELKEVVMDAVIMNNIDKPEMLKFVDQADVSKMTKETLLNVAEEVIENKIELIKDMTKQELKEMVMEVAVEQKELIIVPVVMDDIEKMNLEELKEFVKEASNLAEEKPVVEVTENDVEQMSMEELKEFIMEAAVEETLIIQKPIGEVDIQGMSAEELKDFVMEAVIETKLLEPIIIAIREADLVEMSKEGLKELIMETPALVEKVIATKEASPEKGVTMEKIIEMQKKRKEEKPVKMLIKGGMLFKDGMTTEEKKADTMGLTVKEMITVTEGLTRSEVRDMEDGITVEEMIAIENDVTVEEMIAMKNDLTMEQVTEIKETMTVEEILEEKPEISVAEVVAIKNNMSVEEMVAMKNDVSVLEILEIKDALTMGEIMSLQDGITKEEVVAIASQEVTVEELIEEKEAATVQLGTPAPTQLAENIFLNMGGNIIADIASSGGGREVLDISQQDNQQLQFLEVTTEPPTEVPEILEPIRNTNFAPRDILKIEKMRVNQMRKKKRPNNNEERPNGGLRMRPMRVKVRKPLPEATTSQPARVESHLSFGQMESLMEDAFGLKDFPMMRPGEFIQIEEDGFNLGVTNEDLVLEPTPAVPGRPFTRNMFNEFLEETTPIPTIIAINNIKTVDLQGKDVADYSDDYPIYDSEPVLQVVPPTQQLPILKNSEFPDLSPEGGFFGDAEMPIFTNFPMMQPGQFVQVDDEDQGQGAPEFSLVGGGASDEDTNTFTAFSEMEARPQFDADRPEVISLFQDGERLPENPTQDSTFTAFTEIEKRPQLEPERPEGISLFQGGVRLPQIPASPTPESTFTAFSEIEKRPQFEADRPRQELEGLVGLVQEEGAIRQEGRPFRSPRPKGSRNPNHRYPLFQATPSPARPTPFTARPHALEGSSFIQNNYRHRLKPLNNNRQPYSSKPFPGFEQEFREIPEQSAPKQKVKRKRPGFKAQQSIKPFVAFGNEADTENRAGQNFYSQYGQHDDRPLVNLPRVGQEEQEEEEQTTRPGEIRFGGMSFALPPPGSYPDRSKAVEEEESVSDLYPNHPISEVFPNRPVSEVFRDLPEQKLNPKFPTAFPSSQGIRIEDTGDIQVPSFENFFKDQKSYLKNPFGDDFIKLEIDQNSFRTNKTKPTVHHIPLDIHGFPDVPSFRNQQVSEPAEKRKKRKPLFSNMRKPPYKPPPVITKYESEFEHDSFDVEPAQAKSLQPVKKPAHKASINSDFSSPPSWKGGLFKEAMANIPNAILNLPAFMERLVGNHADWVSRAWNGYERDESAARSLASWDSSPALEDSAAESFDTIDSTAAAAAALWDETEETS